jgi:hypothetical protein
MLRTKAKQAVHFGPPGSLSVVDVPAGCPVSVCHHNQETGKTLYWVEGFGKFIPRQSMMYHDAVHYGIVVSSDDVENANANA